MRALEAVGVVAGAVSAVIFLGLLLAVVMFELEHRLHERRLRRRRARTGDVDLTGIRSS